MTQMRMQDEQPSLTLITYNYGIIFQELSKDFWVIGTYLNLSFTSSCQWILAQKLHIIKQ